MNLKDLHSAIAPPSDDPQTGFEGPEKLLEVWFVENAQETPSYRKGLRSITRDTWAELLKLVGCEIIGHIANEYVDAYLLSESSLFVYSSKIIMKTCGTTTLLRCLERLFEMAGAVEGLTGAVNYVFYSRKSFMFPDRQEFPHTSWSLEVEILDRFFTGSAYVVGKTNGDHWYCYLWEDMNCAPTVPLNIPVYDGNGVVVSYEPEPKDHTLELLMCGIDPEVSKMFTKEHAYNKEGEILATAALQEIYPTAEVDDFAFEPCGYSCNALLKSRYFTVHVTPEQHCSYASFETNIPPSEELNYSDLVARLIEIFKPSRFTVTLFAEKQPSELEGVDYFNELMKGYTVGSAVRGYNRKDKILYEFENYDMFFYHYQAEGAVQKKFPFMAR